MSSQPSQFLMDGPLAAWLSRIQVESLFEEKLIMDVWRLRYRRGKSLQQASCIKSRHLDTVHLKYKRARLGVFISLRLGFSPCDANACFSCLMGKTPLKTGWGRGHSDLQAVRG